MNAIFSLVVVLATLLSSTQSFRPVYHHRISRTSIKSTTTAPVDFSELSVGQELEGTLVSALPFGVFVDCAVGTNVLLPRSVLSRNSYERLKTMAENKIAEKIKLELVGVSAENKTLSGKYISDNFKARDDISSLDGMDLSGKIFKATVVSSHEFGVFAELEEFGVEGLIPSSKLGPLSQSIKDTFPAGITLDVNILEMNVDDKKLVLSLSRPEVNEMEGISQDTWLSGIIESVSSFGLFVRPAGHESIGLVHRSQVPRDLLVAMKKQSPIVASLNVTDVEGLFSAGDVIRCRVKGMSKDKRKLELSMLPYMEEDGDEDDYVVEGRDAEGEEFKSFEMDGDDDIASYDAQNTLLWWKGQPYTKVALDTVSVDEEMEFINESSNIVEGSWRRLFELDLRADQADFSSKILEKEFQELEEEIGELKGLDDDLPFELSSTPQSFGSYVSMSTLPIDWREQMEYCKDADSTEQAVRSKLRGGKVAEQSEFEALLKEVEMELSGPSYGAPAAPVVEASAATIAADNIAVEDATIAVDAVATIAAPVEESVE